MMIRNTDGPLTVSPLSTPAADVAQPAKAVKPAVAVQAQPEPTRAQIEEAVQKANRQMGAVAPSLQFEIDPDTDQVVIRLVDRHDQRVLRQVPSAEMLEIARALERMQSVMVRSRA